MKNVLYLWLVYFTSILVSGCGDPVYGECAEGALGCSCVDGWYCDVGMTCEENICIEDMREFDTASGDDSESEPEQETDTGSGQDSDTGQIEDSDTIDTEIYGETDNGLDTSVAIENEEAHSCHQSVNGWLARFAKEELAFVDLLNQKRQQGVKCGNTFHSPAAALQMQDNIRCATRFFVYDVYTRDYNPTKDHDKLAQCELGATSAERAAAAGFTGNTIGGALASGDSPTVSNASGVIDMFMANEFFCNKLMNETAKYIGVGYSYFTDGTDGGYYWAFSLGKD